MFRRVVYAALASETTTALLLLLLTIAYRQPSSNSTLAAATVIASVLAFLVLLAGVTTATVLTIYMWHRHAARTELTLAGGQTAVALALVLGFMSFSAWFVTHLFCQ